MRVAIGEILRRGCRRFDIDMDEDMIEKFMIYTQELKRWNRTYSLTSIDEDRSIAIKHFLDSILYLQAIPEDTRRIADAGSGAGFPGLPIKIVKPAIEVYLIESSRKKVSFLKNIIRRLDLSGVCVIHGRIEGLGEEYKGVFDVVLSRATFRISDFIDAASYYVKDRGALIIGKGPGYCKEMKGLGIMDDPATEVIQYRLPFAGDRRVLIRISPSVFLRK